MNDKRIENEVVVTGIGTISPLALSSKQWSERFDVSSFNDLSQELFEFDAKKHFQKGYKYWILATQYLIAAANEALKDSCWNKDEFKSDEMGVVIGTNFSVYPTIEQFNVTIRNEGAQGISPIMAPNFSINIPASTLSIYYGMRAFNLTMTTSIVAGIQALEIACNALRKGKARYILVGAVEDQIPQWKDRNVAAVGWGGSCVLVLELKDSAIKRGVPWYGSVDVVKTRFYPLGMNDKQSRIRAEHSLLKEVHTLKQASDRKLDWYYQSFAGEEEHWMSEVLLKVIESDPFERIDIGIEGATLNPLLGLIGLLLTNRNGMHATFNSQGHCCFTEVITS